MKKLLLTVTALAALTLGITSCSQPDDKTSNEKKTGETKTIDLRIKKSNGEIFNGRAASGNETDQFKAEFLIGLENFKEAGNTGYSYIRFVKEGLTHDNNENWQSFVPGDEEFDAVINNVLISDDNDGFKLEFTAPEGYKKLDYWNIAYVDGTGHLSISVVKENAIDEDGKLSVVFPLVNPKETAHFWIQLASLNENNGGDWYTEFFYSVTPVNGLGCVTDLDTSYNPANYATIEGSVLTVKHVIPPMAKNLKHFFQLNEQDTSDKAWGETSNVNTIGHIWETTFEDEIKACEDGVEAEVTTDLKDYEGGSEAYIGGLDLVSGKNKPYVFVYFN